MPQETGCSNPPRVATYQRLRSWIALKLFAILPDEGSSLESEVITGKDGRFRFQGLAEEDYSIQIECSSSAPVQSPEIWVGKNERTFLTIRMRPIQAVVIRYALPEGLPLPLSRELKTSEAWEPVPWIKRSHPRVGKDLLGGVDHDDREILWARPGARSVRLTIHISGFEDVAQDFPISTFGPGGEIQVGTCALTPLKGWKSRSVRVVDAVSKRPVDGTIPLGVTTKEGKRIADFDLVLSGGLGTILLPEGDYSFCFGMYWSASFRSPVERTVSKSNETLDFQVDVGGALKITVKREGTVRWVSIRNLQEGGKRAYYSATFHESTKTTTLEF